VDEQGESSISASTEFREPTAGVPAVRPDAKSPLGMEIAYTYISKLTPASSSAQLANLGLVAIPRLSAFSGLRLLNLSGNSIGRPFFFVNSTVLCGMLLVFPSLSFRGGGGLVVVLLTCLIKITASHF